MAYTIVLAGPVAEVEQAREALAAAGFVRGERKLHGFPDAEPGQAFVTVEGDDIDLACSAVEPLQWGLRWHWLGLQSVEPSGQGVQR
jgi:hypothetical protein